MKETKTEFQIQVDVDQVLRGQGADPASIRARRPRLVKMAEDAIELGMPLLTPYAFYCHEKVVSFLHQRLNLESGQFLSGELIASQLGSAEQVAMAVCTIGSAVEKRSAELMDTDPGLALALDGFANAAVEEIATQLHERFTKQAESEGLKITVPFGPGVVGWPIDQGQPQIFATVQPDVAVVTLLPSALMSPRKSVSLVMGIGKQIRSDGQNCEFCAVHETCRYRSERTKV